MGYIYEGYIQPSSVATEGIGGKDLTEYLHKLLSDNWGNLISMDIANDIKEKLCSVRLNIDDTTHEKIKYELPDDAHVSIIIYDILGNIVNNLIYTNQSSGYKTVQWNGINNQGQSLSAGVYLYCIEADNFRQTRKMILLK